MEKRYKILVVDDEEDLCGILKFNLEAGGYDVETAASAEEAMEKGPGRFDLSAFFLATASPLRRFFSCSASKRAFASASAA